MMYPRDPVSRSTTRRSSVFAAASTCWDSLDSCVVSRSPASATRSTANAAPMTSMSRLLAMTVRRVSPPLTATLDALLLGVTVEASR